MLTVTCCSDLHNGPEGHPANDATPGWREAWAAVPHPKLRLGDMDELWQFRRDEISRMANTDVDGNHDRGSCAASGQFPAGLLTLPRGVPRGAVKVIKRHEIVMVGDTIFLHGHQFDPRMIRWVGRPVTWLVGRLERWWPNVDVRLGNWFQQRFQGGRHGASLQYARRAARYAAKHGAFQIVLGHLHERFAIRVAPGLVGRPQWVKVVCTGCCCNGRMDFVAVTVHHDGTTGTTDGNGRHEGRVR